MLPEHFPNLNVDTGPLSPVEQLAATVRTWLADRVRQSGTAAPADLYQELLRCVEPALLDDVLRRLRGNRWVAAQWLGLNRATVRKKLALYGLHQNHASTDDESENGDGAS
jgi:Fis family transcriptional regulator